MLDKEFPRELLEKLNSEFFECREILLKYKNLGMTQDKMLINIEKMRMKFRYQDDEEAEDNLMDFMDVVLGHCSPEVMVFRKRYSSAEFDLIIKEVRSN